MLISFAVTAKLICIFVFAYMYAKNRFSHDEALMIRMERGNRIPVLIKQAHKALFFLILGLRIFFQNI